ncbi:Myosin-like protein [Phytophthora cinnamomi]|uniref:Myosin-like protein n=1 Tax=Phytophthora cinnamomi TaxID=4785 RepID=UPI00355945CE|nr:Myosin-like protein [Phytophthora cinnamomi]
MVDLRDSRLLRDVAPPLVAPGKAAAESPEGTTASSDDEESGSNSNNHSHGSSSGRPPLGGGKPNADELFLKSMLGLLNKRGYNVRDSALETSIASSSAASFSRSSSLTSTSSTISSVLLALREPHHGQTPLHIAVRKGDLQVLDALLGHESGEELLLAPDFNGNTALHFATGNWRLPSCLAVTERLLEAGASVDAQNKRGLTPLAVHMLTLKIDNPTLVVKLLEAGADPNTEAEGVAVLHLAARRDLPVISGVLVAFGASMLALNTDGLMCYEVASSRVKQFMVRSISKAPAYLPMTQRSTCMRCKSQTLINPKKAFGNLIKKLLGMHIRAHQCSCYHCGMLFCSQCLKPSGAVSAISFVRDDDDPDDRVKTCRLCEAVLLERKKKQASQHAFDMHLMGFNTSI